MNIVDARKFHIGLEFVTKTNKAYVLRFCGQYVVERPTKEECETYQTDFATRIESGECRSFWSVLNEYNVVCRIDSTLWLFNVKAKKHKVCYGADIRLFNSQYDAGSSFGSCLVHQFECNGVFE